jgi:hypothetical protein
MTDTERMPVIDWQDLNTKLQDRHISFLQSGKNEEHCRKTGKTASQR